MFNTKCFNSLPIPITHPLMAAWQHFRSKIPERLDPGTDDIGYKSFTWCFWKGASASFDFLVDSLGGWTDKGICLELPRFFLSEPLLLVLCSFKDVGWIARYTIRLVEDVAQACSVWVRWAWSLKKAFMRVIVTCIPDWWVFFFWKCWTICTRKIEVLFYLRVWRPVKLKFSK